MTEEKLETISENADQEGEKLYYDSMKHLTTLNTGSILLLVTFLETLFSNPRWRALIAISLGSFVLSILFSVSSIKILVMTCGSYLKLCSTIYWVLKKFLQQYPHR